MKILITIFSILTIFTTPALASFKIAVSYPYIAEIVKNLTVGQDVKIYTLGRGDLDPHFIVPIPSLVAHLANADALIINGGQLEIGWLPALINQSNNPKVRSGASSFLDLSLSVELIQVPRSISRAQGDIHPDGNPHFHLNPHNIPILITSIKDFLCRIDTINSNVYMKNYKNFASQFQKKLNEWDAKMLKFQKRQVKIIEYHKLFDYVLGYYNLNLLNTVEVLPGIPPTQQHIEKLIQDIKLNKAAVIYQDIYHSSDASKAISKATGIPTVILPHDVNALPEIKTIFDLYDYIINQFDKL